MVTHGEQVARGGEVRANALVPGGDGEQLRPEVRMRQCRVRWFDHWVASRQRRARLRLLLLACVSPWGLRISVPQGRTGNPEKAPEVGVEGGSKLVKHLVRPFAQPIKSPAALCRIFCPFLHESPVV
jgi:hypothetical protein